MGFAATIGDEFAFAGAPSGTAAPGVGYILNAETGSKIHTIEPSVAPTKHLFGFNALYR